jgi:hypothetical protein
MKDIRLAFRQILLDDPTVASLSGGRIYPVNLPQGVRAPSLVYFRITDFSDYHMLGDSGLQRVFMQLDTWADKHDATVNLADAAHDALSGVSGRIGLGGNSPTDFVDVRGIFQSNGRDLYDTTTQLFRMSRDYQVAYDKASAGFTVLSVNLSNTLVNLPATNSGGLVGTVTMTTEPPGFNTTVTIGGLDAGLFRLTNGE